MIFDIRKLTPGQRAVYVLIRDGQSEKEIANTLSISLRAVKHRAADLYRRLGLPIQIGARRKIQANYQDTLKNCEFNCMLAIASVTQRLDKLEKRFRAKHKRRK